MIANIVPTDAQTYSTLPVQVQNPNLRLVNKIMQVTKLDESTCLDCNKGDRRIYETMM